MTKLSARFVNTIKENSAEIRKLVAEKPDWKTAEKRFDAFFKHMVNPKDPIWSETTFKKLQDVYFAQKEKDNCVSNITIRTVSGMPSNLQNYTKIIFLQTAETCCLFNASHKVNFAVEELPSGFDEVKMMPSKVKGSFTYACTMPSIYKKISLTFDYWMPKIMEWTEEIRSRNCKDWRGENIHQYESCTDFMRVCLLFLSDIDNNPPIAKAGEREALLKLMGEEFIWIKKSAKREDIIANSEKLNSGLSQLNKETGIIIPLEAWSRVLQTPFIKSLIK